MRLVNISVLGAVFLVGTMIIALLPPFEAFDEAPYWSAVQSIADTGIIPRYGQTFMARDADAYPGPLPNSDGQPYAAWFAAGVGLGRVAGGGPSGYVAGHYYDYEAQHPPLFYLLMAVPYRAAAALTWPWHMFVLRMVAWSIAFVGFAWGALVTQAVLRRRGLPFMLLLLPLIWPFVFPQFFPEFTRISNDTLCLLLMAAVWHAVIQWLDQGASWRCGLAIGLALSLGLLTKAFFLPVTAGVACLLVLGCWLRAEGGLAALLAIGCPVLLGGPWYLSRWLATGVWTGAGDTISLVEQGGLLAGLQAHFSLGLYALDLLRMAAGFCWAGTWSFAHPSRVFIIAPALLILWPIGRYLARVRRGNLLCWAPIFIVAPVLAGLLYHLLGMVAAGREDGGTPGWFFHIFAGPLALAWVLGWGRSRLLPILAGYSSLFGTVMMWMQAAFFSGCLPRAGRGELRLRDAACFVDVAHLRLIALPSVAGVCLVLAFLALTWAALQLVRHQRGKELIGDLIGTR